MSAMSSRPGSLSSIAAAFAFVATAAPGLAGAVTTYHWMAVAGQQWNARVESAYLDMPLNGMRSSVDDRNRYRQVPNASALTGGLPRSLFARSAKPIASTPLKYKVSARLGGLGRQLGGGGRQPTFGRIFAPAGGDTGRTIDFGGLREGAGSFSFGFTP